MHHVNVQAICGIYLLLRRCSHTVRFSTRVVLQVSGDAITSESGSNLASLITENSNVLIVDITEVSVGKKVYPDEGHLYLLDD